MAETGRINVDYDKCLAQAKRIEELTVRINKQSNAMNKLVGKISEVWQGDSGLALSGKIQEWVKKQNDTSNTLFLAAQRIKTTVRELQEAETKTIQEINRTC